MDAAISFLMFMVGAVEVYGFGLGSESVGVSVFCGAGDGSTAGMSETSMART